MLVVGDRNRSAANNLAGVQLLPTILGQSRSPALEKADVETCLLYTSDAADE